ncbi:3-deoxy-7-phosphoheptulonate synthase [Chondromyces apiculatus]|uniref:2-keto-3-deoxy-D-arabino-heptulosonate-7-phosphate synthase I beta n=1 Tax=Chondromyces apiculatus DSM 436 TaxID=1192034 RepID=A0A017TFB1_9BACT|nr:3-deoxy-7-phosphoheptulonate synthase [Chondromyces apiculatus]EYF07577.1 2-keto-3-deoxy-D-arabino-heptulosonate-7-phosphate synthase I beta [Chondromyces apiculatus DSM 436]
MIVSLKQGADAAAVMGELSRRGLWVSQVERGAGGVAAHYVIAPHSAEVSAEELLRIEGVAGVTSSKSPHPLLDRQGPVVMVGDVRIEAGARRRPIWMCGPCSVESEGHAREVAGAVAPLGVQFLRGGAFKPRTSPYAFQGAGAEALTWLRRAADAHGLKVVTEAMSEVDVPAVAEHADLIQVGSRNMHNYALLKSIGRTGKPALLKRGMAATLEEWVLAAEYLLSSGASGVVLAERGIRSFDPVTRNLLDLGAVALLSHVHKLPVIVDPSHGVGRRDLILPMARASIGAGAAGVMIEVHEDPARALSDGPQALRLAELAAIVRELGAAPSAAASAAASAAQAVPGSQGMPAIPAARASSGSSGSGGSGGSPMDGWVQAEGVS